MSSGTHSRGNQSSPDERLSRAEPELALSARRKISMLPELRRQQSIEQQSPSIELREQQHDRADTVTQSSAQVAELSRVASDTHKFVKPSTSTRYTISSRIPAPVAANLSPPTSDTPRMPEEAPPAVYHHRKPSYVVNVTDFDIHRGETAITKPPVVGADLLSRLESLRQFKEWSARINDSAHQQADLVSIAGSQHTPASTEGTHPIERCEGRASVRVCSARIEQDLPLRHDSELLERNVDAPTPFSSPQVIPVPFTTHTQLSRQPSTSLPDSDLSAALLRDAVAPNRPTGHLKTMNISSEPPALQLAPISRSASRSGPDTQVPKRANSKPRSHPPISFPKDFYERFPHSEETPVNKREYQSLGRANPSPGVSSKTLLAEPQEKQVVPGDIEPLATPHEKRGRPTFYTTIHYFTECPHASPPSNRPLDPDAQPRPNPKFHSSHSTTIFSIIPGACFDCDVANRRCQEDGILNTHAAQMAQLTNGLAKALDGLELDESDDEEVGYLHDRFSARLLTLSTFAEDKYDLDIETEGALELPPLSDDLEVTNALRSGKLRTVERKSFLERVTEEIRDLEARIDRLRDDQDEQIRKIWSGFTPLWGPATLGVQGGRQAANVPRTTSADRQQRQSQHPISIAMSGTDEVPVVTAGVVARSVARSNASNGTSRDRSGSSRSRSGTRTPTTTSSVSARDMPGSRTPGEGKMRIGWIREGKS